MKVLTTRFYTQNTEYHDFHVKQKYIAKIYKANNLRR